jgi:hypothetical protein
VEVLTTITPYASADSVRFSLLRSCTFLFAPSALIPCTIALYLFPHFSVLLQSHSLLTRAYHCSSWSCLASAVAGYVRSRRSILPVYESVMVVLVSRILSNVSAHNKCITGRLSVARSTLHIIRQLCSKRVN